MPILAVASVAQTIDQQCAACGKTHLGLPIGGLTLTNAQALPGQSGISVTCPDCGAVECFNTNLGPEDENTEWRGMQASRIRALQVLLGVQRRNTVRKG